ncbi:succinate dehydrogenase assembly factor 2 [Vogesella sp. XCS3]|jgi:succinate dehydrogenase flavin-adding protein (antitoxin of CptAB toxin-antitoxin module)|uniref:FAD assembly factor SdhE n=1 Tax=unclassified Vogesella TaxID=2684990 RepID=UPI0011CA1B65|nr:succinate dehydrogenase assembly factor 2 [Vogesella sp. XCS3]UDM18663.1 succinate dehydrogenase assembly factor 2 [Vogesella sp. XCS3]
MTDIDPVEIKRIRWRSRRGLLELDIVLERFLANGFDQLTMAELAAYRKCLELGDNDFLDYVNGKAEVDDPELAHIIGILRAV